MTVSSQFYDLIYIVRTFMSIQTIPAESKAPFFTQCSVWLLIFLHVLRGALTLSFLFPLINDQKKQEHIQRWSRRLLSIFNIQLRVKGAEMLPHTTYLLASNHISWLDIHVINAFRPVRFVAKSEVASWPVFGWMAKQLRTVFIRRDSARHARHVVGQVADVLKTESICIFPEGTSTLGDEVLAFKPNLFESATVALVPVYPMAIQYLSSATGKRSYSPAFIGEMGLLESMANVVQNRHLIVELAILPPMAIPSNGVIADRKDLAQYSQEAISKALRSQ
jgi:1-acyl-sn-glycerol-3-phosphate acyltransferase